MKAKNGYNYCSVTSSDKGGKIYNQQKLDLKESQVRTSHDERDDSYKCYPTPDQVHKPFQCQTQPMDQDSFEKKLVLQEKRERELARERYVAGIQGRDGGKKPYETRNINN